MVYGRWADLFYICRILARYYSAHTLKFQLLPDAGRRLRGSLRSSLNLRNFFLISTVVRGLRCRDFFKFRPDSEMLQVQNLRVKVLRI